MRKILFFLPVLFFISIGVNSQVIRGTVTSPDGEPISGVKVFAGEGHLSFSRTDKEGIYEIRVSENATQLKFSCKTLNTVKAKLEFKNAFAYESADIGYEMEENNLKSASINLQ